MHVGIADEWISGCYQFRNNCWHLCFSCS